MESTFTHETTLYRLLRLLVLPFSSLIENNVHIVVSAVTRDSLYIDCHTYAETGNNSSRFPKTSLLCRRVYFEYVFPTIIILIISNLGSTQQLICSNISQVLSEVVQGAGHFIFLATSTMESIYNFCRISGMNLTSKRRLRQRTILRGQLFIIMKENYSIYVVMIWFSQVLLLCLYNNLIQYQVPLKGFVLLNNQ